MKPEKPKGMPDKVWEQVQNLKSGERHVREYGAWALGELKHESAVEPLAEALKDPSWILRSGAVIALGKIKHENAVSALIQALKDKNGDVRARAAEALGEIGHASAVPHLIKALKDEKGDVRRDAAEALGKIKHKSAELALTQVLLEDKEDYVRWKADDALRKIACAPEKQRLTPEGEKLSKAHALVKPHFLKNEDINVIAQALQAAYNGEIDEENARLTVKQLRAHKGHLK